MDTPQRLMFWASFPGMLLSGMLSIHVGLLAALAGAGVWFALVILWTEWYRRKRGHHSTSQGSDP